MDSVGTFDLYLNIYIWNQTIVCFEILALKWQEKFPPAIYSTLQGLLDYRFNRL